MRKEHLTLSIDEIKPYEKNARKNDDAVDSVAKSIEQCEYIAPIIIDEDNIILAGHTRYKALKQLNYSKIDVIKVFGLTDEQKRKYRLLDNKTNELAQWDFELLEQELDGLDFDDLGLDWGVGTNEEFEYIEEDEPEVEFAEVIGEEHNYIVLYFDNEVDWLQAQSLFDIKTVKCGSTRKDKKITSSMERKGIGRVLKGAEALNKILGAKNENIG